MIITKFSKEFVENYVLVKRIELSLISGLTLKDITNVTGFK